MASTCCICMEEQDSIDHTFWKCKFGISIWNWLNEIFAFKNPSSFEDIYKAAKNKSPLVKEIWLTASCDTLTDLWFQRNEKLFEEKKPNINRFKSRIFQLVYEGGYRTTGNRWGQNYDSQIMSFCMLGVSNIKYSGITECYWKSPTSGYTLFCCDGSSFGNPGSAGFGIIARDNECQVIGTLIGGLAITTNFIAELYAILCALKWAVCSNCKKVIVQSDSLTVINLFKQENAPWFIRSRWVKVLQGFEDIQFYQVFREVNFFADSLDKKGARLNAGERIVHMRRPSFIKRIEMPGVVYHRFH
ncbi:uncharacterized protein LOC113278707 [Papaver somniferum]|uniref:uncharacterized protein LOC113278707 n=1 Tax=Papaver somniferum TaxID=3469 RepID=UPI000E6FE9EB|nr:uncharacterized protein LOC113278707 [Papaver somniferum]